MNTGQMARGARPAVFLFALAILTVITMVVVSMILPMDLPKSTRSSAMASVPSVDPVNTAHPFQNVVTVNQLRVTLLSIARETIFETDPNRKPMSVPCVRIAYVVESLSQVPIKTWKNDGIELELNGRPARKNFEVENVYEMDRMPTEPSQATVSDPSRANGRILRLREDELSPGFATLVLHQGVNDTSETFRFENVPVR